MSEVAEYQMQYFQAWFEHSELVAQYFYLRTRVSRDIHTNFDAALANASKKRSKIFGKAPAPVPPIKILTPLDKFWLVDKKEKGKKKKEKIVITEVYNYSQEELEKQVGWRDIPLKEKVFFFNPFMVGGCFYFSAPIADGVCLYSPKRCRSASVQRIKYSDIVLGL